MEHITYTNAELQSFTRNKKGGTAKFIAPLTVPVMKALELTEIPDFATSLDAGEIHHTATEMMLRAKEGDLADYEVTVSIAAVSKFEVTRLETKGKRGKGSRLQLSFVVSFADATGCAHLEQHLLSAGPCNLRVSYERTAVQTEIEIDDGGDDRQGVLGAEE